jgi:hypothetical protein
MMFVASETKVQKAVCHDTGEAANSLAILEDFMASDLRALEEDIDSITSLLQRSGSERSWCW